MRESGRRASPTASLAAVAKRSQEGMALVPDGVIPVPTMATRLAMMRVLPDPSAARPAELREVSGPLLEKRARPLLLLLLPELASGQVPPELVSLSEEVA